MFPRNAPAGYLNVNGDLAFTKPKSRVLIYASGARADQRTIFTAPPGQNAVFGAMPGPGAALSVIQVYGSNLDAQLSAGFRYGDLRCGAGFVTLTSAALGPDSTGVGQPVVWPLRFNCNGIVTQIGIDGSWSFNNGQTTLNASGILALTGGCSSPYFEATNFVQFDGPAAANQFRMSYNTPAPTYQLGWNFNGGATLMSLDNGGALTVNYLTITQNFTGHEVMIGAFPYVGGVAPGAVGTVLTSNGPSAHPTFQSVAAAGAMVRLQQVVCAGSQNVVNFPTIPAGYSSLLIMYQARETTAGSSDSNIFIRFNADATAANYDTPEAIADTGTTLARASPAVSANGFAIITIPNNGSLTNRAGIGRIEIPNYAGGFWKQALGVSSESLGTNAAPLGSINLRHGEWRSTAPITSIDLIAVTAFLNNSVFTLYGML